MEKDLLEKLINGKFTFNLKELSGEFVNEFIINKYYRFSDNCKLEINRSTLINTALFLIKNLPINIELVLNIGSEKESYTAYKGEEILFSLFLYYNNLFPKESIVNPNELIDDFVNNDLSKFKELDLIYDDEDLTFKNFNEKAQKVLKNKTIITNRVQYISSDLTKEDMIKILTEFK